MFDCFVVKFCLCSTNHLVQVKLSHNPSYPSSSQLVEIAMTEGRVYRDYANVTEDQVVQEVSNRGEEINIERSKCKDNFPVKLHCLLSEAEKDKKDDIISWQPHGRSFVIHDKPRFEAEMLPL